MVWLTELMLLAMATIWGVNFSVVKFATGVLPPATFNALRVGVAAVTLLLIAIVARSEWPPRGVVLRLMALGVLGHGLYQTCFAEGVAHSRAGDAALVIAATPAFIAAIGHVRGTERLTRRAAVGIALSMTGIALVVLGSVRTTPQRATVLGAALMLAASLSWATYTVLLQPYTRNSDGLVIAALTLVGGLPFILATAVTGMLRVDWPGVPTAAWGAVLYSGIASLVVAYLFWYRGVRVIGPTRTAMFANLQPAIALLVAWITLDETPRSWQLVGAVAIFAGLLLSRRTEPVA